MSLSTTGNFMILEINDIKKLINLLTLWWLEFTRETFVMNILDKFSTKSIIGFSSIKILIGLIELKDSAFFG